MKLFLIKEKEILDFEEEISVEIIVRERPKPYSKKFYAQFHDTEVLEGNILSSKFGDGDTIDEAILDYCKEIEGKTLVISARTKNRIEIKCPTKLVHTKLSQ